MANIINDPWRDTEVWDGSDNDGILVYSAGNDLVDGKKGRDIFSTPFGKADVDLKIDRSGIAHLTTPRGVVTLVNIESVSLTDATLSITPPLGSVIRGNSLYTIVEGPSWIQAEANAVKLGGHLVSIGSEQENQFIVDFASEGLASKDGNFAGSYGRYIGLTDTQQEGTFRWMSGETVLFQNWYPNGEPNSYRSDGYDAASSDFGEIFPVDNIGINGIKHHGKWNDSYGEGENSTTGIAETPFIRRGNSAYAIVQGPTWEEAEANAQKLGGHLVTINDAAENEWITSTFGVRGTHYSNNAWKLWIGLKRSDLSGELTWISGEPREFYFFHNGTNQYSDNYAYTNTPDNSVSYSGNVGVWVPTGNQGEASYGIAEIKLAPNNTPIGTPTLSGTFKTGQVITIDKTPIQDADNFTRYTPDFKYSWEVFTNGTSWTKLTSTDASDNNTTYTLTPAEVGKRIRGVVSYVDGYGTNEIVVTDASSTVEATNRAPTNLTLSSSGIRENSAAGTAIGTLSAADPDAGASFSYALATGNGTNDADNSRVAIVGNQVRVKAGASIDFDTNPVLNLNIQVTDNGGLTFTKAVTANVINANEAPTNLIVSSGVINENTIANSPIATLETIDPDITDSNNTSRLTQLLVVTREIKSVFDAGLMKRVLQVDWAISVTERNGAKGSFFGSTPFELIPKTEASATKTFAYYGTQMYGTGFTDISAVSDEEITSWIRHHIETAYAGHPMWNDIEIQLLNSRSTDSLQLSSNTFNYSLTSGEGDTDNTFFIIDGNNLKIQTSPDFESKPFYSIRVRTTDQGGLSFERSLTLNVNDVNEAPLELNLTSLGIQENSISGAIIGTLSATDPDANSSFSYALAAGDGTNDADNTWVEIVGNQLRVKAGASIDFETNPVLDLNIQVTDNGGLTFTKAVTVNVIDISETARPGITVRSLAGGNQTTEQGGTSTYSFVLDAAPTDPVTLRFTLSDATEASLSAQQLIFTSTNWNTAQSLTVTGLDDFEDDGDVSYTISTRVISADPNYGQRRDGTGGVSVANLVLTNKDDGFEKDLTIYGDRDPINLNDILEGKNGKDRLYGDKGRDRLRGGRGDDRLYGGVDDDTLWGDDGNDQLFGDQDDDTLYGGKGNDRLTGGEGYDLLIGGEGNDTYIIDDEFDIIDDQGLASDVDTVIIRANLTSFTLGKGIENATLEGSSAKNLTGNASNNTLTGNSIANSLVGGAGNDRLIGGGGNDVLYAGDGNDAVEAGIGNDLIIGGNGAGNDRYNGGAGIDTVRYTSAKAGITVDLLKGTARSTAARDAAGIGADTLTGIENVIAGSFNDSLIGNSANNVLTGGTGADQLRGGNGQDTFRYTNFNESRLGALDRIFDLKIGTDRIDAPRAISAANVKELGKVSALTQAGIQRLLGTENSVLGRRNFAANQAATFSMGSGISVRTFLAINNGVAGFNANTDGLIEITGFSGNLNALAVI